MNISLYITELLQQYNCVAVPNLGSFQIQPKAATFHSKKTNTLYAPTTEVIFTTTKKHNDDLLLNTIVFKEKVTFEQAKKEIQQYAQNVHNELAESKKFIINNVGKLYMDNNDNLRFQGEKDSTNDNYGLPKLTLNEINRTEQITKTPKKQKSKLGVLLFVILSIVAITLASLLFLSKKGIENTQNTKLETTPTNHNKEDEKHLELNNKEIKSSTSEQQDKTGSDSPFSEPDTPITEQNDNNSSELSTEKAKQTTEEVEQTTQQAKNNERKTQRFHVVLGLFRNKSSAENVLQNALLNGYKKAYIIHGKQYHRVVIPFDRNNISWLDAQNDVRTNLQPDAWVWETQYK